MRTNGVATLAIAGIAALCRSRVLQTLAFATGVSLDRKLLERRDFQL
jgi:hypothetical protein